MSALRIVLAAVIASASFSTVAADTFLVADEWTYDAATAVTEDTVYDPDPDVLTDAKYIWHDATTKPLKLRLAISEAVATSNVVAPSASFISITGASPLGAPVTTGYTISAATVRTTSDKALVTANTLVSAGTYVDIVVTFDSTAPAGTTYSIKYDCGLIKDGTSATAKTGLGTDCAYSVAKPLLVRIGWVPLINIFDISATLPVDVTSSWIDLDVGSASALKVSHKVQIQVTPGKTLRDATDGGKDANDDVYWPADGTNPLTVAELFGRTGTATDAKDAVFAYATAVDYATASTTGFGFKTTITADTKKKYIELEMAYTAGHEPGTYYVRLKSGALMRSDYARSAQTVFTVRAGFRLTPSFLEVSTISYDAADSWFPADKKIAFKVLQSNLPTGYFFSQTATTYGRLGGQLLAGMSALPGGVGGGANTNTGASQTFYQYPLVTGNTVPGKYTFDVSQGVIVATKSPSLDIRNARVSHDLKIGFKPIINIVEGTAPTKMSQADERKIVTTNWINLDKTGTAPTLPHALVIRPPTGAEFSDTTDIPLPATVGAFLVIASTGMNLALDGKISFGSDFAKRTRVTANDVTMKNTTYIEVPFGIPTTYTPGKYDFNIASSVFTRASDGVKSCKYTLPIMAGFKPDLHFVDAADVDRVDVWFLNSGGVDFTIESAAVTLDDTIHPDFGILADNLLAGMATLPGARAGVANSGIKNTVTASNLFATNKLSYRLDMTNIEPGTYKFTVANGALKSTDLDDIRNYAESENLKIGFSVDWELWDLDDGDLALTSPLRYYIANPRKVAWSGMEDDGIVPYLNPKNNHKIVFKPGSYGSAPKSFSADTVATPTAFGSLLYADARAWPAAAGSGLANTAFLGGVEVVTGEVDEGRIAYKLAKKAAEVVGPYSVFLHEEKFFRELTGGGDAANVEQEIAVNVGFGLYLDFTTDELATAADVTSNEDDDDGYLINRWWRFDSALYMWLRPSDATYVLPTSAPDWVDLFDINPGKCATSDGISHDDVADTLVEGADGYGYELRNIPETPGQYHFALEAGKITKDVTVSTVTTTYGNYYVDNYLKIGFPTAVDFVDENLGSLMASATSFKSEPLSPLRTTWRVRAQVLTDDSDLAIKVYDTTAPGAAVTADDAFSVDDQTKAWSYTTPATGYPSLNDGTHSIANTPTPRYIATFNYNSAGTDTTTAGSEWSYIVIDGVFCTNSADIDEKDVVNKICNAATNTAEAGNLIIGTDLVITIEGADKGTTTWDPYSDATTEDGDYNYNTFNADFTKVYELPIFAPQVRVQAVWAHAPSTKLWASIVSAPAALAAPTDPSGAAAADMTWTWAISTLTPGTYDIEFLPNTPATLTSTQYGNPRARIRLVIGPKPIFYMLDVKNELVPRRAGGPFAIGMTSVYLALSGFAFIADADITDGDRVFLSDLLMVLDSNNAIVTSAVTIEDTRTAIDQTVTDVTATVNVENDLNSKDATAYRIGLDGLTDGTYTFIIGGDLGETSADALTYNAGAFAVTGGYFKDANDVAYLGSSYAGGLRVSVIIDRTPPVVLPATYIASTVYTGLPSGEIPFIATLFNDVGTPDEFLSVSVDSDDARGLELVGTKLSSARLSTGAAQVRDPPGNAFYRVTATDEAGNSAVGVYTIPIVARPSGVLTAIDRRTAQSKDTLLTGGRSSMQLVTAVLFGLPLKLVVDFDVPVSNVDVTTNAANFKCTIDCVPCTYTGNGAPKVTAAAGGKRFTYDFILPAAIVTDGAKIELKLVTSYTSGSSTLSIKSTTGNFDIEAPSPVYVTIDTQAPIPVTYLAPYRATVNVKYSLTLPSRLFYDIDGVSTPKKIKLVSSSPASQFGLTFTSDLQGNATISGIPVAQPPSSSDNRVIFNIVGQDEAGNNGEPVSVIIEINKAQATAPILTVKGTLMTFTETDNDVAEDKILAFDTGAIFSAPSTARFYAVKAYLIRPENDEVITGDDRVEKLQMADGATFGSATGIAYAVNKLTGEGSIGLSYTTSETDEDGVAYNAPALTPAAVQTWLRSLQYFNNRKDVTGGNRVIRVDVWAEDSIMIGQRTDANGDIVKGTVTKGFGVAATAVRTLKVLAVNNIPTVDVVSLCTWDETVDNDVKTGKKVFVGNAAGGSTDPVIITDTDDNDMTAAYLSIALTGGEIINEAGATVAYSGCDKARDKLVLDDNYINAASTTSIGISPQVVGTWSAASCTLTIIPAAPRTRVTKAEISSAISSVRYWSLDPKNPVNFAGSASEDAYLKNRYIVAYVEDAANQGKLADKKRSAKVEDSDANVFTTNILTLTPFNNPPTVNKRAIFGFGGVLSSTNKFANMMSDFDDRGAIKIKAFPLVLPATYDSVGADITYTGKGLIYTVAIDLTQVTDAAGNLISGQFAKGQITDVDSASPPDAGDITLKGIKASDNTAVDISTLDTNWDPSFLDSTTGTDGIVTTSQFVYSATADSILTLVIKDNIPTAQLGPRKMRLAFGTDALSTVDFYVDIRRKACLDSGAGRYNQNDDTTETYVLTRISDLSATNTDAENLRLFFPENALCAYRPTAIVASSGESYDVNRGGYAAQKSSLDSAFAALAATGADITAQVAALKDLRNAARGSFTVGIPAGSLASRGSMDLQANKADSEAIRLLPPIIDTKEVVDTDVAIKLQPAGTTFSSPVKICLFAGDAPDGTYKVMAVAQQKDPGDPSKGYLPWEKLFDQSYNPATGEVCGYTLHFSVFAPITRPLVASYTIPKSHLMGGACPNQCSGHGTCRQEGQCACFSGFEGYDCSMRVCPSAESWGQDQEVMHTQSECSGRGVCQRESGQCQCYDGFEGSACERSTCPNECSGHGKCRLMSELPKVQQAGYNSWELKRLSKCVCDGGYTGGDCSLRLCPFGDDPETVCDYDGRQVQRLTLDFVTDPTGTGMPDVDLSNDQFSLIFTTAQGKNYTTPMIDDIWDGTRTSAMNMANALKTLPEFAVVDVKVSTTATTSQSLAVHYDVTFTGSTNSGNEFLMSCPFNSLGSTGCPAPGCRPKFTQLRIFQVPPMPQAVQVSPLTVLQQPKPLGTGAGDKSESTSGVFGVETTLVINKYSVLGSIGTTYTYKFVNTKVYSQSVDVAGVNFASVVEETPIPPSALRKSVPGPYGLLVDFGSDTQLDIDYSGSGPFTYNFAWRLPKCSITNYKQASRDLEKAECSNRGLCNRQSGECDCFIGYAGYVCSQQTVYT